MSNIDEIRHAKEAVQEQLLAISGVHAVGIGHKNTKGQYTDKLSIKVYVISKKPIEQLAASERIPAEINGFKTDVVETGLPELAVDPDLSKYRPVRGGTCIGLKKTVQLNEVYRVVTKAGTLGCFAKTTGNPSIVVGVTNGHVVAFDDIITAGDAVGQASGDGSSVCSKCFSEIIGEVLGGVQNANADVGLIKLNGGLDYYNQQQNEPDNFLVTGIYSLKTSGFPISPLAVKKRGATTRLTTGTLDGSFVSMPSSGLTTNLNLLAVKPDSGKFIDHGDSGAVLVSAQGSTAGNILGLLFAVSPLGWGWAADIGVVQAELAKINLSIEILVASSRNAKQTVPDNSSQANAYRAAAGTEGLAMQRAAADARLVQKMKTDLAQTRKGERYVELVQLHQKEIRTLIEENPRVAAAWRHNGGPLLVREAIDVAQSADHTLATEVAGRPLMEVIKRLVRTFSNYCSSTLAEDLSRYGLPLGELGGRTYGQITAALRGDLEQITTVLDRKG